MRTIEVLVTLILALRFAWPIFSTRRPRWVDWLPTVALVLSIIHLLFEGYRWQMIPIYVLVIIAFLLSIRALGNPERGSTPRKALTIAGSILALVVLILSAALPVLLPVPRLPEPTGPYEVGTLELHLVDQARQELYSPQPGAPREVMVQIWYPAAEGSGGDRAPWMDHLDIMGPEISNFIGMPSWFIEHVEYARTNSFKDAPVSSSGEAFPVLLFSHGWSGFRQQNTYQVEELASHGYVVASVQHPFGAMVTIFPDGRVAPNNPQALPQGAAEEEYLVAARQLVDQWADDLAYVLDTLEADNQSKSGKPFSGRLDLEKIGAFGHSTGGGAAIEFCGRDDRCQATLGLDPFLTPVSQAVLDVGLEQPALYLYSETWPSARNDWLNRRLVENSDGPVSAFSILGTAHYDFTDMPMLSPLAPYMGFKGPLNGERVLRIINDYTLAFFGSTLNGEVSDLLTGEQTDYPEILIKESHR